MPRSEKRVTRRRMAKLWMVIASCSILATACAGPDRSVSQGSVSQNGGLQSVTREAAIRSVEQSITPPTPEKMARIQPAVMPASFQEVGEAPTPASIEQGFVSQSPQDFSMSLEEVLLYTIDHHPLLQARAYEVEAARGRVVTAGLLPNPRWVMDTESPVAEDDATRLSTRLTFTLPTGRKRQWRIAATEAGVTRSQAALARETELLLAETADAATKVLYLQELATLQGELSQLAAKTAEFVEGQFQGGTTPYTTTIKSRLDAAEIELARLDTLGKLQQARVKLNRAAGLPPAPLMSMQGELVVEAIPSIRLERLLAEATRCRPDLAESRAALLESQRQHSEACAEARPDIDFGPRVHNALGEPEDRVGARLAIDLPLFDRNQGRIAESAAITRTRSAMLDATKIDTLNDVAAAFVKLQAAQTQLDYHRTFVQPFVEQSEAAIRGTAADRVIAPGQISELMEQLARMRVEQLDLRYIHTRLRMRLELLLGGPLEDFQDAGSRS